jgi:hypothetical protein
VACPTSSSSSADRIHSTDIAFKPNKDGWGYSKRYSSNYENIFQKKNSAAENLEQKQQQK